MRDSGDFQRGYRGSQSKGDKGSTQPHVGQAPRLTHFLCFMFWWSAKEVEMRNKAMCTLEYGQEGSQPSSPEALAMLCQYQAVGLSQPSDYILVAVIFCPRPGIPLETILATHVLSSREANDLQSPVVRT